MSEQIIEVLGQDGQPVLINLRYVAFITPAVMAGQNGTGPRQLMIGLCAAKMMDGTVLIIKATLEDLSRAIKSVKPLLMVSDDT